LSIIQQEVVQRISKHFGKTKHMFGETLSTILKEKSLIQQTGFTDYASLFLSQREEALSAPLHPKRFVRKGLASTTIDPKIEEWLSKL